MRPKPFYLLLAVLLSVFNMEGQAADHNFTVRPSLEKHIRFSYKTETGAGTFNSGYPKDYTSCTGTYELNYYTGMVVLQEYSLPSDIDWSKVAKVTIQTTVDGTTTGNGYAAYWIYDADATSTFNNATTFGKNTSTIIGVVPKTTTGTVNDDAVTTYASRTQIDDTHYNEIAEITGDKLTALKEKLYGDDGAKKLAFVITRQGNGVLSNIKKFMYTSNDANNTDAGDFRPIIYIDYYTVWNPGTQKGYDTLSDAVKGLGTDGEEDVLELNGDVTLDSRLNPSGTRTLTLKPTRDGVTLKRGSLMGSSIWFLTNQTKPNLNIGCDEYQLIIDGENKTDNTNSLLGHEYGTMNVTNVKFINFDYTGDGALNKTSTKNGAVTLKNVTVENSKTNSQFFVCSSNDKLTLDGSLNFNNCTGTHIQLNARIKVLNGETFTISTPVTLAIAESLAKAGTLIVKANNKAGADNCAPLFIEATNNCILVCNTASGHVDEIVYSETKGYTLKVTAAKAATFVLPYASTIPEGVKAYTLTYTSGDEATATEVTETLPANTPVLTNAEEGFYQFKATGTDDATTETTEQPTSGCLVGTYESKTVPAGSYVLQNQNGKVAFYKIGENKNITIKANQAYLVLPSTSESAAKSIGISFNTTGIKNVKEAVEATDNAIYTLSGMKVSKENMIKGHLYITKGKTFIAR